MKFLGKSFLYLLIIITSLTLISEYKLFTFNDSNYWDKHGLFFLFFITLSPRLTLLLSSVASGGVIWWLAWLFTPRFLVAWLGTLSYWNQNPFLVILSWIIALKSEYTEKKLILRGTRGRVFVKGYKDESDVDLGKGDVVDVPSTRIE